MDGMQMTPQGADPAGYAIVVIGVVVTALTFALAIANFVRPGERDPDHPKYRILREDR